MTDIELAEWVQEAYDRYHLAKVKDRPESGYIYKTDTLNFIIWLKTGKLPEKPTPKRKELAW